MPAVDRISPKQATQHMQDNDALLVCAYDSNEKFEQNNLQGAISLDEFRSRAGSLSKDHEIIFY